MRSRYRVNLQNEALEFAETNFEEALTVIMRSEIYDRCYAKHSAA